MEVTSFFSSFSLVLRGWLRAFLTQVAKLLATLIASCWNREKLPLGEADDVSVHLLVSKRSWHAGLLTVISFELLTERHWEIFIHDDGTLTPRICQRIKTVLPGIHLVLQEEALQRLEKELAPYPTAQRLRQEHPLFLKFFDIPPFAKRRRMIMLDADVIFYRKPQEILDWVDQGSEEFFYNEDDREKYSHPRAIIKDVFGIDLWPRFNSGLMLLPCQVIDFGRAEEFLRKLEPTVSQMMFFEQTLYGVMATEYGKGGALPPTYEISWNLLRRKDAVARHYIGKAKEDLLYLEAVPFLLFQSRFLATIAF